MSVTLKPEVVYEFEVHNGAAVLGKPILHEKAEQSGVPQACVYVALRNPEGKVFIQHRAVGKQLWPNRKTISASGHVEPGETFEQAARRELEEELGIRVNRFTLVGVFDGESHCGPVYEASAEDIPNPNPQELDVAQSRFMSAGELEQVIGEPSLFTPSGRVALRLWLAWRQRIDER